MTRTSVRLLGPCFKTGRRGRRSTRHREATRVREDARCTRPLKYPPRTKLGERGSGRSPNFTRGHSPFDGGSWREAPEKCSQRATGHRGEVLADRRTRSRTSGNLNIRRRLREPLRLPLFSFTYSLTLSSKFFSTFPHGTCLLSVSGSYLVLRGVYLAL